MPSVSFIIPLHNRAGELPPTLECLLAQTSADWEAIVVDDHSTDGAADVAREYASRDARIRVVALNPKRGAPAGRNLGASMAAGEFVIFLDSDDLVAPTCVERRVAFMRENPDFDFAVWRCQLFRQTAGDVPLLWNADTGEGDLDRLLKVDVPWQTTSPIWRRSSLTKLALRDGEYWDESALSGQDWEFHTRAVAAGLRYERVAEVDCFWRMTAATRDTIGRSAAIGSLHARSRPATISALTRFLDWRGVLTPARRRMLAATTFRAAEAVADRHSNAEARKVWRKVRDGGTVTRREHAIGARYLLSKKWPSVARRARIKLLRSWPADLLAGGGPLFLRAPMGPPAVSVVMSAFNNAAYIEEAVRSILGQTFGVFEFVIIDDGSTDGTGDLLADLARRDGRIRLVRRQNKGLTVSLNDALALARGEFIARMDGDDVSAPDRFERQLAYLRVHPECVLLGTAVTLTDPLGVAFVAGEHHAGHDAIEAVLMRGSGAGVYHPSTMMRRDAIARVGGYKPEYNGAEDIDLFLRLAEIGRIENLADPLLHYRIHPQSVNHTKHERQRELVRQVIADARSRRGLPPPVEGDLTNWTPEPIESQRHRWAWNASKLGRRDAARAHALAALRARPTRFANWKLLACMMRGR